MDEMDNVQALLNESQDLNLDEVLAAVASSTVGVAPVSPVELIATSTWSSLSTWLGSWKVMPVAPCSASMATPSCFGPEERAMLNEVHQMVKKSEGMEKSIKGLECTLDRMNSMLCSLVAKGGHKPTIVLESPARVDVVRAGQVLGSNPRQIPALCKGLGQPTNDKGKGLALDFTGVIEKLQWSSGLPKVGQGRAFTEYNPSMRTPEKILEGLAQPQSLTQLCPITQGAISCSSPPMTPVCPNIKQVEHIPVNPMLAAEIPANSSFHNNNAAVVNAMKPIALVMGIEPPVSFIPEASVRFSLMTLTLSENALCKPIS
ncbi:hypothetical protein PIB30_054513 [Stylosanthes scabra]|uniref:Uncharacterized protein n=1 Tax=Stylosanthes scabra TaxID=79078 RepID=A0ABU6UL37_9FABA|nr:hypothetical protein [Stylosanthes scabra]